MSVYLIGTGPGDPELLTLKASRIISRSDVLVYDDLIPGEILLLARKDADRIYVGKRGGRDYMSQDKINDLLAELGTKGLEVARLKGGDPCIFGRGGEEALFLRDRGIPVEIIPGITSAIAGPISIGIPPTHRGLASSVTFVTAHEDPAKESGFLDYSLLARQSGTIIFLMGATRIAAIAERLVAEGMDPQMPCALVQDATTPKQRHLVTCLDKVGHLASRHGIASPCVMIVGKVAELSSSLHQDKVLPLHGMSILITRPRHLALQSASLFASAGAIPVIYPLLDIRSIDFALPDISHYDMVIFTSQNAVPLFMDKLFASGLDARAFSGKEIVCIGPKTRDALRTFGITADIMAQEYRAEGIMAMIGSRDLTGQRICIPRAKGARSFLITALRQKGAEVLEIPLYETALPSDANPVDFIQALSEVNTVLFTSPSGVRHASYLLRGELDLVREKRIVAIGPVTAQALEAHDVQAEVVPDEYTDAGIIEALKGTVP